MTPKLKTALLELGAIGGVMLAFLCIAEGTRDKVTRELREADDVWTRAAKLTEDAGSSRE
jgi:hypothetical protein